MMEPTNIFSTPDNNHRHSYTHTKYDSPDGYITDTLYKTKFCPRLSSKNECRYGDQCPFAHCTSELRPQPDFRKTKLCTNFMEKNCCHAGRACSFAHGEKELKQNPRRTYQCDKNAYAPQSVASAKHEKPNVNLPNENPNLAHSNKSDQMDQMLDYFKIFCSCFMDDKFNGISIKNKEAVLKILQEYKNNQSEMCDKSTVQSSESGHTESELPIKNKKTRRGKRGGRNKNKECNKSKEPMKYLAYTSTADNQDVMSAYNCLVNEVATHKECAQSNQSMGYIQPWMLNNSLNCNKDCEVKLLESLGLDSHCPTLNHDFTHFSCIMDPTTHFEHTHTQTHPLWNEDLIKNTHFYSPNLIEGRSIVDLNSTSTHDCDNTDDVYETPYSAISSEAITDIELEDKLHTYTHDDHKINLHTLDDQNMHTHSAFDYDAFQSLDLNFASRFIADSSMFTNELNTKPPLFDYPHIDKGAADYNLIKGLMNMNLNN